MGNISTTPKTSFQLINKYLNTRSIFHPIHSSQDVESVAASINDPAGEVGWNKATGPSWSIISGMVFGDCMCNFSDGLTIGVAWTLSWTAGLGTTLAIVLHKLPNELGDFIVYKVSIDS